MTAAEFRLGSGTLSAATLNASTSYLLENFAVQSDQYSALWRPWGPPMDHDRMYPRRARYRVNGDQSQTGDGDWEFNWLLAVLTEGMLSYFEGVFFSATDSALVTVKTLKSNGNFQVYNATMLLPVPGEHYKPSDRGVENYTLRFVGGAAIS